MQPLTHTLTAHLLTGVEVSDRGRRAISSRRSARRSPRPASGFVDRIRACAETLESPTASPSDRGWGRCSVDGRADGHNRTGRAPLER
jgi:hypothetical protein